MPRDGLAITSRVTPDAAAAADPARRGTQPRSARSPHAGERRETVSRRRKRRSAPFGVRGLVTAFPRRLVAVELRAAWVADGAFTARASVGTHAGAEARGSLSATSRLRQSGDKSPHSKTVVRLLNPHPPARPCSSQSGGAATHGARLGPPRTSRSGPETAPAPVGISGVPGGQPAAAGAPRTQPRSGKNPRAPRGQAAPGLDRRPHPLGAFPTAAVFSSAAPPFAKRWLGRPPGTPPRLAMDAQKPGRWNVGCAGRLGRSPISALGPRSLPFRFESSDSIVPGLAKVAEPV